MKSPAARGRQGEVTNSNNPNTAHPCPRQQFAASPAGRAAPFGPWSPDVGPVERTAQFRALCALSAAYCGSSGAPT